MNPMRGLAIKEYCALSSSRSGASRSPDAGYIPVVVGEFGFSEKERGSFFIIYKEMNPERQEWAISGPVGE